jgi:hypothetical protein
MEKNKMDGSDCPISVKEMRDDLLIDIFEQKIRDDWYEPGAHDDRLDWYSLDEFRNEIFRRMSLSREQ